MTTFERDGSGRVLTAPGGSRPSDRSIRQSEEYRRYMASPVWHERRKIILARDGHRCQRCGAIATDVHHKTYARLGNEDKEDLVSLCRPCHAKADQERASETAGRAWDARLDGWASKKYGEDWADYGDADEIEEEFGRWLEDQGFA